jgi:type IV secretion system protein VirD4
MLGVTCCGKSALSGPTASSFGRSLLVCVCFGGTGMGIRTRITCLGVGALIGLSAATQIVAWRYNYQPALGWGLTIGKPTDVIPRRDVAQSTTQSRAQKARAQRQRAAALAKNPAKLYPPWNFLVWQKKWGQLPAHQPTLKMGLSLLILGFACGGLLIKLFDVPSTRGARRVRGWGNLRDAKHAKLLSDDGCAIGYLKDGWSKRALTTTDMRPTLVTGATRSGKGRGHVVPTLLLWRHSVIVHDPKSELYTLTAGWRAPWSHALVLNPRSMHSARFNPLAEIRRGPGEMADVQRLVSVVADPAGRRDEDSIWDIAAAAILEAVILHVLYAAPAGQKTLVTVKALVSELDRSAEIMNTTLHRERYGVGECHPVIAQATKAYLSKHDKYRSSVEATVQSYLKWIAGDDIERTLGASDFKIGDLVCLDAPMSLYVQVAPADQKALRPFLRLLFSAVALGLTTQTSTDTWGRPKRHPLLMVMDEFPLLGRLDFFEKTLRLMSGYGIKPMLVAQSLNDIVETYGPHNTILDNTHVYTAFAALDPLTQDKVSKLTGLVLEDRNSVSTSGALMEGVRSRSAAEHERPLLEPGEVRGLPDQDQLVFVAGYKPWRCQKIKFDQMEPFKTRAKLTAPDFSKAPVTKGLAHPWDEVNIVKMGIDPESVSKREAESTPVYDPQTGEVFHQGPPDRHPDDPGPFYGDLTDGGQNQWYRTTTKARGEKTKSSQMALNFTGSTDPKSISNRATPRTPPNGWGHRAQEADYLEELAQNQGGHDVDPFAR